MRYRAFATTVFTFALVTASCDERFPARLSGAVVHADASVDAPKDAEADVVPDAGVADAAVEDAGVDAESFEGGACNVRFATHEVVASPHVADGTGVAYTSNPPSSGPHYGSWANFQEFTHPVADGYLVHALEHGAVLLLYKCEEDAGACEAASARLRAVRDAVATDPSCEPGIRVRVIIAPRPENDTFIAAAAWGHTYHADCVDAPSLAAFINAHYAQGPENLCFAGSVF